ncbi:hypothetical protein CEP52_017559 [Fusarium oligoseptatum]|uniref:Uncharacterized protein n=1 Tax=Fusarium oligoseptatum TaxID=2604345 RepID=A0A428RNM0_9HYPO|nr:hypothetical protein CEP52_017559 [Fusarium oligoseptatum]
MHVRIPSLPHDHRHIDQVVFTPRNISTSSNSSRIFPTASNRSSGPLSLPVCGLAPIMHVPLLPTSAAPFAPRASSVSVVMGSKVEPWLTQALRRINRVKGRRFISVPQHEQYLTETLSSPNAIWTLALITLPSTPEADFKGNVNDLFVEADTSCKTLQIEGYVVCVDMVLRNEVTYKLTKDTIGTLIQHHKDFYCVDVANTRDGGQRCKELHEEFVQAINKFVFYTKVSALKGLEAGGRGELLNGEREEVKSAILSLMEHPHRRVGDVTQQTSVFPNDNAWPEPDMPRSQLPVELCRVAPWGCNVASPASTDNCLVSRLSYYLPQEETAPISALGLSNTRVFIDDITPRPRRIRGKAGSQTARRTIFHYSAI